MRGGGVLWLAACLVKATHGQFLTIDHSIVNSESPKEDNTENLVDRNDTLNNDDNKSLDPLSTANNSFPNRDLSAAVDTNEGSISRESQSHESKSVETPSHEIHETIESTSAESSDKTDSQENVSAEKPSAESLSADRSGDADSGSNSNGEVNGSSDVDNEQIVQTTHGPVKGHKWQETEIFAYIDIQYGKVESPFEVRCELSFCFYLAD